MKKNIGILGLGKSGISVANLALKLGNNVFASETATKTKEIKKLSKKILVELGGHSDKILNSDIIIKSPGLSPDIPILKKAKNKKIKILSELSFALLNSKYKKIIAVTGTNGKTTTTDLISKIIKSKHKDSIVVGNIGLPLSAKALTTTKNTYITMELSSYQLEDSPNFKANISVLLNISPDHLSHHKTMKAYIRGKENVFVNQNKNDFLIVNYDDKICRKLSKKAKSNVIFFSKKPLKNGIFYDDGKIVIQIGKKYFQIKPKINIVGMHNIENILASVSAAYFAGIHLKSIEKVISKYKGVPHRIEFVKNINGVSYYNDSKATNVDSTRVALESFDKNINLIMGGQDKGFPYTSLKQLIKKKVKAVFLIGEASNEIKKDLRGVSTFFDSKSLEQALKQASMNSKTGDIVLFSPACASFDSFKNFEERGNIFKCLVNKGF
ncbi:MAG: UDP-N-acetylmuramoyl-L-alanine--D-glutamate ligase [Endomicrobium sp.]|jgi:UDP-N-acetylmuramoylalanine--D-glutamate ligase|nr:UDP-N-acetylmuramoyl-L-alanine--D-glutamate ligase [Endomicrobium sp.]